MPTEAEITLARAASLARLRLERLEARALLDMDVDDEMVVRLAGALGRTLSALAAQKQLRAPSSAAPGAPSSSGDLAAHLRAMVERKRREAAIEASEGAIEDEIEA